MRRGFAAAALLAGSSFAPAAQALDPNTADRLHINGYGSLEFEKQLGDDGKGDPNGSFDSDGFDLVLNAAPTDRFRVAADLTWEHGAATEDGRGNVAVEYSFAEFRVSNWLKVRGGKMFVPFGTFNEIHTAKILFLTVKEPFSTDKTDKLGSPLRFFPRWAAGLAVLGNGLVGGRELDYDLQLGNGEQGHTNPFEADDNAAKAVAARVRYRPLAGLTVSASLYHDSVRETDAQGEPGPGRTGVSSVGFAGTWEARLGGFEAEYLRGTLDPSTRPKVTREGLYAMAWAQIRERWRPYLRFEFHDPDRNAAEDQASILLGGLNVKIDRGLFFKAEVDHTFAGVGNTKLKGIDFSEFKASLSFGF